MCFGPDVVWLLGSLPALSYFVILFLKIIILFLFGRFALISIFKYLELTSILYFLSYNLSQQISGCLSVFFTMSAGISPSNPAFTCPKRICVFHPIFRGSDLRFKRFLFRFGNPVCLKRLFSSNGQLWPQITILPI